MKLAWRDRRLWLGTLMLLFIAVPLAFAYYGSRTGPPAPSPTPYPPPTVEGLWRMPAAEEQGDRQSRHDHALHGEQHRRVGRPADRDGPQHPPADGGPEHEGEQGEQRPEHGQVARGGEGHPEDVDVPGHVAGEHLVEAEVPDGIRQAGGERQRKHEAEVEVRGMAAELLEHG